MTAEVSIVKNGRAFPEDVRIKAPLGIGRAIAEAAAVSNTTRAEFVRRAILRELEATGLRLRRGSVEHVAAL
jgi:hypothetical protein